MVVREKTFSYGRSFTLGMFVRGKAGVCGQHRSEWSLRGFRRRVERPGYACCVWVRSAGSSYIRERRGEKRGREEESEGFRRGAPTSLGAGAAESEGFRRCAPTSLDARRGACNHQGVERGISHALSRVPFPYPLAAGPLQATETQEPKAPVFASPAPLQASLRGAGNAKTQR